MPARDIYHETVKRALIKDGWTITHDPLKLSWGGKDMFVDLGATQLLAAEKGEQHIAVEIKSLSATPKWRIWHRRWGNISSIVPSCASENPNAPCIWPSRRMSGSTSLMSRWDACCCKPI